MPFNRKSILFLLLLVRIVHGQNYFSVNPNYIWEKREGLNILSRFNPDYPDTSVHFIHNFFPRNFLGNIGLPSAPYLLGFESDELGFRYYDLPLRADRWKEGDVKYLRSAGPFASLTGIAGSKQLQIFKALFTHTYKGFNFTVGFQRYTSLGFYNRQQTYTNNFYFSSNYTNKSKRMGYYFFVLNNSNKNNESGGIRDTVLNDSTMRLDKQLLHVRIDTANRDDRETVFMLNPYIMLTKPGDTARKSTVYLQLRSSYAWRIYRYGDQSVEFDGFYKNMYFDTLRTRDSSHTKQLRNEVSIVFADKPSRNGVLIGFRHEYNRIGQAALVNDSNATTGDRTQLMVDSTFSNLIGHASVYFNRAAHDTLSPGLFGSADFQYVVAGPASGNSRLAADGSLRIWNQRFLRLDLLREVRSPDYIYGHWRTNNFVWSNPNLKAQKLTMLKVTLPLKNFLRVSIVTQIIRNYLYFDQEAKPAQVSDVIRNLGATVNLHKVFFRHLGLELNYTYQNTSKSSYVRIPPQVIQPGIFYYTKLFRNAMQLQFGAQAQIYDSFSPLAYMPSSQVFYLQKGTNTNGYPYVDVYFNVRIRPVTVFFRIENLLQNYAGPDYFLVPRYYQPDRAFRFGLNWLFFD